MSASSSFAISCAILFSNPSRFSFENGRLFGSAVMRRMRFDESLGAFASGTGMQQSCCASATLAPNESKNASLRQREDIEHSALRGFVRQIVHRVDETERAGRIAPIKIARDDRTRPTADAAQDRDVLFAIRSLVGDRLADDAAA